MARQAWAVMVAVMLGSSMTSAEVGKSPPPPEDGNPADVKLSPGRRVLATSAALFPGVLVHGSGLYAAGDRRGGKRLLAVQGVGLAAIVVGAVPFGLSGGSPKLAFPSMPLIVSGGGLFLFSWLADIYGAAGLGPLSGPPLQPPPVDLSLAYAYVDEPRFDYGHFTVAQARFYAGDVHIDPSAWIAADADNQRLRLGATYRWLGATAERRAPDNTVLYTEAAATYHRFGDDGFDTRTAEMSIGGRLDMGRVTPLLRGSFLELSTGMGVEWLRFSGSGQDDVSSILLGTAAFGMRLGTPGHIDGQWQIAYDHRRDDFAAGLSPPGQGGGFVGHVGARGDLFVGSWGIRAEAWFGLARVYQIGFERRLGGRW